MLKRRFSFVIATLAVFASAIAATPTPPPAAPKTAAAADPCASKPSKWLRLECEDYNHSAPGDEYFGRMKMSYLGINNTFHDEAIRAGDYTTDSGIIGKVGFADEALEQWAHKYPNDPQLARSYFLAIAMYKKIYTQVAQEKAWSYMHILTTRFGSSYFGKLEKADLSRGFTEHYFALPQLCPTPLPSGVVAINTISPAVTASPSPAPGHPNVDIITPPCVQPSPIPTEEPMASPEPSPTPTPTP